MNLLERVADYDNLCLSFNRCSRGKKQSMGYQKMLVNLSDELTDIRQKLLSNTYRWGEYRSFIVHDPKARLISAPAFRDRVVHTAICEVIEPILDKKLSESVYACRKGKGSRYAVIDLIKSLKKFKTNRFVVKLDVSKYFDSIDHGVLLTKLFDVLSDRSLDGLLKGLIESYSRQEGKAIPIGSLTSQLFANFYLASADAIVRERLGVSGAYLRYMDDMVIMAEDKRLVWTAVFEVIEHTKQKLLLEIPFHKRAPIGNDPVPFLGFVVDQNGYRILARNRRRFGKKLMRMAKRESRDSCVAEVKQSFEAWRNLEPHLSTRLSCF